MAGSLPRALVDKGHDARVILPLYSRIAPEWREQMSFCLYTYADLGWRHQYCGLLKLEHEGVTYYFVDNEFYFKRGGVYGEMDDGERFAFFCKAVLAVLPHLEDGWKPEVINCNDWQTALIPIYLRLEQDVFYRDIRSVFTIHNIEYQGRFGRETAGDLFALPQELFNGGIVRYDNDVNLMKGAIYQADRVTTVSPTYARELRDPFFAHGLQRVIEDNGYKFSGIVNGLDTKRYDPKTDKLIPKNFTPGRPAGKAVCKKELCSLLGLDPEDDGPIIACVSRLVGHKGFNLVADGLEAIIEKGLRLVLLGTGDRYFEGLFADAERRHKGRVSANIMYSEQRAMYIYSGADMMLMPSRSEPCGLTQMIAMRYGTVPIVRATGGLNDTVRPYGQENANGFTFNEYSTHGMLGAIDYALSIWNDKPAWKALMKTCLKEDLSWTRSADEYISVYRLALN